MNERYQTVSQLLLHLIFLTTGQYLCSKIEEVISTLSTKQFPEHKITIRAVNCLALVVGALITAPNSRIYYLKAWVNVETTALTNCTESHHVINYLGANFHVHVAVVCEIEGGWVIIGEFSGNARWRFGMTDPSSVGRVPPNHLHVSASFTVVFRHIVIDVWQLYWWLGLTLTCNVRGLVCVSLRIPTDSRVTQTTISLEVTLMAVIFVEKHTAISIKLN